MKPKLKPSFLLADGIKCRCHSHTCRARHHIQPNFPPSPRDGHYWNKTIDGLLNFFIYVFLALAHQTSLRDWQQYEIVLHRSSRKLHMQRSWPSNRSWNLREIIPTQQSSIIQVAWWAPQDGLDRTEYFFSFGPTCWAKLFLLPSLISGISPFPTPLLFPGTKKNQKKKKPTALANKPPNYPYSY